MSTKEFDIFNGFEPIPLKDFMKKKFHPSKKILGRWLTKPSINMIHSESGMGKTHYCIAISFCLCEGIKFCEWEVPEKQRILYIDAEMPGDEFQNKYIKTQLKALELSKLPKDFYILPYGLLPKDTDYPKIDEPDGKLFFEKWFEKIKPDVVFFDSLEYLLENAEDSSNFFKEEAEWLKKMRDRFNMTIFLIHHDNRQRKMAGKISKTRMVHVRQHLVAPPGKEGSHGIRLNSIFKKARGINPVDNEEIEIQFNGKWNMKSKDATTLDKVVQMIGDGWKQKDIAEELDISEGRVSQLKAEAKKNRKL